nr:MAG TPA: hypothetical protein [Caudoviricetes sp.]
MFILELDYDDYSNMPEETFEVENLIVHTPEKNE